MADPLSIIGGIETCANIALLIYNTGKTIHDFPDDVEEIWQDFNADRILLQRYLDFFKDHEQDIAEDIVDSIGGMTPRLETSLREVARKLGQNKDGGMARRLGWPLVKGKLQSAQASLRKWVNTTHLILQRLPQVPLLNDLERRFTSSSFNASYRFYGALLSNLEMKQKRLAGECLTLQQMSDQLEKPEGPFTLNSNRIRSDLIAVPQRRLGNLKHIGKIELEVARLVDALQESVAKDMHIPRALSYFKRLGQAGNPLSVFTFGIAYETPTNIASVRTLSETVSESLTVSLSGKIQLARQIAAAVGYVHAVGWVHKAINSSNILIASKHNEDGLGSANLVGFSGTRRVDAVSTGIDKYSFNWKLQLYTHPERQGRAIEAHIHNAWSNYRASANRADWEVPVILEANDTALVNFSLYHDIYSLGVVLLEIGLWRNLESFLNQQNQPLLQESDEEGRRTILKELAKQLRTLMGDRYYEVVRECLNVEKPKDASAGQVLAALEGIIT